MTYLVLCGNSPINAENGLSVSCRFAYPFLEEAYPFMEEAYPFLEQRTQKWKIPKMEEMTTVSPNDIAIWLVINFTWEMGRYIFGLM